MAKKNSNFKKFSLLISEKFIMFHTKFFEFFSSEKNSVLTFMLAAITVPMYFRVITTIPKEKQCFPHPVAERSGEPGFVFLSESFSQATREYVVEISENLLLLFFLKKKRSKAIP